MKTTPLFPKIYRKVGLVVILIAVVLLVLDELMGLLSFLEQANVLAIYDSGIPLGQTRSDNRFFEIIQDDFRYETLVVLILTGLLFVGFSKRATEDELVQKIRLESLLWATYIHFFLFILLTLFTFGLFYLNILVFSVFTILLIYILRFEYKMYQLKKSLHEK